MKSAERLAAIRKRLQISMADMAVLLGLNSASAYAYYEDPHRSSRETVPPKLARALLHATTTQAAPISYEEMADLIGTESMPAAARDDDPASSNKLLTVSSIGFGFTDDNPSKGEEPVPFWLRPMPCSTAELDRAGIDSPKDAVLIVLDRVRWFFPEGRGGDYLLVNKQDNITTDGYYVFSYPDAMYIYKCAAVTDKGFSGYRATLVSNSHKVPTEFLIHKFAVAPVWGLAVWHGRSLVAGSDPFAFERQWKGGRRVAAKRGRSV